MNSNNVTIGIDLGDRRHAVCVLSASGDIVAEDMITNSRECLTAFAKRHPEAVFVMETGTHSPWVSDLEKGVMPRIFGSRLMRRPIVRHTY